METEVNEFLVPYNEMLDIVKRIGADHEENRRTPSGPGPENQPETQLAITDA